MTNRKEPIESLDLRAHINEDGLAHHLRDHLTDVAVAAKGFAEPSGSGLWAHLAGLWHDLGKYRPGLPKI